MNKSLPRFKLKVDKEKNALVSRISIVKNPAIESPFIKFSNQEFVKFSIDNDKMELWGAALIPDMPIYRNNDGYEYEVFITKEDIRLASQLFFEKGFNKELNLEHTNDLAPQSFFYQSYIVDTELGLNPPKGIDVPDGTWMVGAKINDKNTWELIKAKRFEGFSIEGIFDSILVESKQSSDVFINNKTNFKMSIKTALNRFNKEIMSIFQPVLMASDAKVLLPEQVEISDKNIGGTVQLINEDGTLSVAEDGNYIVDNFSFTVKDGAISAIADVEVEEVPVDAADDVVVEEQPTGDQPKEDDKQKQIDELKSKVDELSAKLDELLTGISNAPIAATKEDVQEFQKSVEKMSKLIEFAYKVPANFNAVDEQPKNPIVQNKRIQQMQELKSILTGRI